MRAVSFLKRLLVRLLTRTTGTWVGFVRPPRDHDGA